MSHAYIVLILLVIIGWYLVRNIDRQGCSLSGPLWYLYVLTRYLLDRYGYTIIVITKVVLRNVNRKERSTEDTPTPPLGKILRALGQELI
jgi:hypothetical protein